ncbi:putative enzyme related to lactoylglutathione lyase [Salirhabdus euzebyi]|uniref:Putative enzyme related to lactoylglutathione lyase n=1 Tax=Salirhabdus euzebyi TaxID=394506 RepID=A0A841PUM3_9BACI|nr:VOC family protein [Salirhabdus euzebyi]MBB6452707.1 putative enzyme related to lactoylglutathione lyase [Salirhabdus euzebyi]
MLNTVCVVTIKVKNMIEAVHFYTNILDFHISKKYSEKLVSLVHEHVPIILEEVDEEKQIGNNILLGLQSKDIEEDVKRLKGYGVHVLFDEAMPCPPGKYNVFLDPSGNQIELLQFLKED